VKEKVMPLYEKLRVYSERLTGNVTGEIKRDIVKTLDEAVRELNVLTGNSYDRYRIIVGSEDDCENLDSLICRMKLGGLLSQLRNEFLANGEKAE